MLIIELLKAIFFGIIEGITEWLPVSSTGHLILVQEFIRLNQDKAFIEMFNIVIQLGAIIAVMLIYFERLNPLQPGNSKRSTAYLAIVAKSGDCLYSFYFNSRSS